MTIREIDEMCQEVEAFILKKKGERVTINRTKVIMDIRQVEMLIRAYNLVKNGKD